MVLALDLGVFTSSEKPVTFKEASIWSAVWISLSVGFFFFLKSYGHLVHGIENMEDLLAIRERYNPKLGLDLSSFEAALAQYRHNMSVEYITGYVIEYALSADNIFVMIMIFTAFKVPERYYKKVLFWGILGAVVMRFGFIFLGSALLQSFSWIIYVFGAFLALSGLRMLFFGGDDDEDEDPQNKWLVRFLSKRFAVYPQFVRGRFFVVKNGKRYITPLFIVLIVIEVSDLIFAVDSVPAVFSVTKDPQIVFFSNIFAILGLRSMFFFLSNTLTLFHRLKTGLAVLLTYIGLKMLAHHWLEEWGFKTFYSLIIIVIILAASIAASLIWPPKEEPKISKEDS